VSHHLPRRRDALSSSPGQKRRAASQAVRSFTTAR